MAGYEGKDIVPLNPTGGIGNLKHQIVDGPLCVVQSTAYTQDPRFILWKPPAQSSRNCMVPSSGGSGPKNEVTKDRFPKLLFFPLSPIPLFIPLWVAFPLPLLQTEHQTISHHARRSRNNTKLIHSFANSCSRGDEFMHRKARQYIRQSEGGSKMKQQAISTKRTKITSLRERVSNIRGFANNSEHVRSTRMLRRAQGGR